MVNASAAGLAAAAVVLSLVALATVVGGRGRGGWAALEQLGVGGGLETVVRAPMPQLHYSYKDLEEYKIPVSGRCRCTGMEGKDPDQRVVCACSSYDNLWNKGPYDIITGYPVVYDKRDDDPHDYGKYLTIQGYGYTDGGKKPPRYYTLIQPFDDFGQATMPEVYPDGPKGIPKDAFFSFETPWPDGIAFKQRESPQLAGLHYLGRDTVVARQPELGRLFEAQ